MRMRQLIFSAAGSSIVLALLWSCPFDISLREYLYGNFWLPFAKHPPSFERPNVRRIDAPFAGMGSSQGGTVLVRLRDAYQVLYRGRAGVDNFGDIDKLLSEVRADRTLTRAQREEVDLIDAKMDMREGDGGDDRLRQRAKSKLIRFLRTARTPAYRSEARGWLAHIYYTEGNQTAAGKIYIDELNRNGSNLSRETLFTSLRMTYQYNGGDQLLAHLEEYFDTPEHAAFAIQLLSNPQGAGWRDDRFEDNDRLAGSYKRIRGLLEKHKALLGTNRGANALALLNMRIALRMGDPEGARKIAESVGEDVAIRQEPDYLWMLGASCFLSRDFAAAEAPVVALFESAKSNRNQKAAAAYGLCGIYRKLGDYQGQLRYALWLAKNFNGRELDPDLPSSLETFSVYWAQSGMDMGLMLDVEAPTVALEQFVGRNPDISNLRPVKYSLAVRLARENRYQESAELFDSIHAVRRAPRMRQLAQLYQEASRSDVPKAQQLEAKFRLAQYISENDRRLYFNDLLWTGLQRYALRAAKEPNFTAAERAAQIAAERKLKDDQEEYWRAYLILREVAEEAGKSELGRRAAKLAIHCLRKIATDRFERTDEIRHADIQLSALLRSR